MGRGDQPARQERRHQAGQDSGGVARVRGVFSTTVEVPPGDYRLRVAAVDVEDRIGVLESAVTAGYETTGATVAGDLIVGVVAGGQLEPRRRIAQSEEITAMLEVRRAPGSVLRRRAATDSRRQRAFRAQRAADGASPPCGG